MKRASSVGGDVQLHHSAEAARAPARSSPKGVQAVIWTAFAVLFLIQCLPFLTSEFVPLLDYPNHLARIYILDHWAEDSLLRQYYEPHWGVLPNLALDGVATLLGKVLPIYLTGRLCLLLAIALLTSGVAALSRTLFGRVQPFCLLMFLFVFSEPFAWGFVNVILGFGLAIWGVALWLRLRDRPVPLVAAIFAPFAAALFLAHLFAFGAYGVIVACIEISAALASSDRVRSLARSFVLGAVQAAVPAWALLFASPTLGRSSGVQFGDLVQRVRTALLSPVRNYSDAADLLGLAAVAALLLFGFATGRLRVAKPMRLALVAMALLCFMIPSAIGTSGNAEIRLPVITLLVLAGSARWEMRSRGALLAGALALALLFCARTAIVAQNFREGSRFTAALLRALDPVPPGARIASITVTTAQQNRMRPEWLHAICYEIIEKSAFVPSLFSFPEQQPVLLAEPYRHRAYPPSHYVSTATDALKASDFVDLDYVVVMNAALLRTPLPDNLQLLRDDPDFKVFRVLR